MPVPQDRIARLHQAKIALMLDYTEQRLSKIGNLDEKALKKIELVLLSLQEQVIHRLTQLHKDQEDGQ